MSLRFYGGESGYIFKEMKRKNQILKIVLVNVKEVVYSPDTVFTALDSTLELKKTAKQLIRISTLRNKLI